MKKIILSLSFLAGLVLVSCESADQPQDQNADNDNSLMRRQRQSSMFNYIQSTRIESDANCENNILIFPSWRHYWETIDRLDQMVDRDCEAFDSTVPNNISEERYDILADASGFDEDNVLRRFETDLGFCSLRSKIESLETAWLDRQGDREWDANSDPDNHFIDDQAERTLLSPNAEVIVGDDRRGYVYYKFLDDEGSRIEVLNNDRDAISQVSRGRIPTGNPNVVVVRPDKESDYNKCKNKVTQIAYEVSGADRFKRKSKVRRAWGTNCLNNPCTSIFPSKVIAITKGYKKKNGKWRSRRMLIAAGINGLGQNIPGLTYVDCIEERSIRLFEEKKKRKIRVVAKSTTNIAPIGTPRRYNFSLQDNKLFSYHKRGNLIVNKDYYDMPGN
ncbi:hypothetical protein [uncultured Flavobacterium sp.]|uniref:hypothetical protein n=1 Tax=uncultured Flavobacterium sp. TaxID=165435 RepID=UPI0011FD8A67|nr:hypothetical protein [uncultured Flavobacterium sp.]THD30961.1 MAG: hypothetical protein DI588_13865 [Flavobacterium johnsoniae]